MGLHLALVDVCAKKCGIRTFWHDLALRLLRSTRKSARFAVDTTDFVADFLAALVPGLADPEVRRSHTPGSCRLATSCTWLSMIWPKILGRGPELAEMLTQR